MSLVTYASTHATATGISESRDRGEQIFRDAPASLSLSYTYDAGLVGVVQDGTTTFTVPDLSIRVDVPGYFRATASPGTIAWTGDTIDFHAILTPLIGEPSSVVIDVVFAGDGLTAGTLPASLAGLEGVPGQFSVQSQGSLYYRGDGGQVYGTAVAAPEPASAVLFLLGMVGCLFMGIRRNRRVARQPEPVEPSPQPA